MAAILFNTATGMIRALLAFVQNGATATPAAKLVHA
jgi:hypothetical protein